VHGHGRSPSRSASDKIWCVASSTGRHGEPTKLCADGWRARIATVPAVGVPVIVLIVMAFTSPSGDEWTPSIAVTAFAGASLFAVVYMVLTWRVFGHVDAAEFAERMRRRTEYRRPAARRFQPWGDGPSFAISAALVAFAVVIVVPHVEAIRADEWLLVPVSMAILLSCWGLSVMSYALHYAQYDLAEPSLDFPGRRTNAFADYAYFSIAVATTFGATDVSIKTPEMRRIVNLNVIVAFVYNSVIVALLASILIR
jgi:uncharacterized membrane protein